MWWTCWGSIHRIVAKASSTVLTVVIKTVVNVHTRGRVGRNRSELPEKQFLAIATTAPSTMWRGKPLLNY